MISIESLRNLAQTGQDEWGGLSLLTSIRLNAEPEAPTAPIEKPANPVREDPHYPSHTPPRPAHEPEGPAFEPDSPEEDYPACRGTR